jgi:alpha-N-arabinofuranosidase
MSRVGNEDNFDNFEALTMAALRTVLQGNQAAKYPALQLIATMPIKNMRPDVVDEHYYVRRQEFFADQTHYDKTDRTGPKIFVGEWATREGAPTPNFGSGAGRRGLDDRHGAQRRPDCDGQLCAAAGECESGRDAVGDGSDRLRRALELRFAQLLGAGALRQVPGHGGCAGDAHQRRPRVFASATRDEKRRKLFVKVVNATSDEAPLSIALEGIGQVKRDAHLITLSGKTPNATNSITHPDAVVPVEHRIQVAGPKFEEKFAPYSINVLELSY